LKNKNKSLAKNKIILLSGLAGFIFLTGFFTGKKDIYFDIAKNIDVFTRVYKEISFNYVDEVDPELFIRAGIQGMLNSLDPYTVFLDEKKQDDIELLTKGKYGGIGVTIGVRDNKVTIIEVMDGYSAQRQGIFIGDIILEVNGTKINGENFDDVSPLVKGEPGTFVELKIQRDGVSEPIKFNILREEITVKNVTFCGFYPESSNNVYIKLTGFSRTAGDEVKRALLELKKQKEIESVIFDLRGNPGGLLDAAVNISNRFLNKGQLIVSTKGRDSLSIRQYFATEEPILPDVPLILLVNEGSASASEIVAGAIQDHDRGLLIGEKTFGKGLVQTVTPLSYNTSIKITTSKYYTPSGRCIQKIDYSKKNKSILKYDSLFVSEFNTDHKRTVYSSGGITPDSVVLNPVYSDIIKDILAKGFFFKFSNFYYSQHSANSFGLLNFESVFTEFKKFLKEENYFYSSPAEKKIEEVIASIDEHKNYREIKSNLTNVKNELNRLTRDEMDIRKDEIIRQLKIELASRFLGGEGRIKEFLNNDLQFNTAYNIIRNKQVYNKILNHE